MDLRGDSRQLYPPSIYIVSGGVGVSGEPLAPGMPPKPELFHPDRRRVIGLHLEPGQFLIHRQRQLGARGPSAYPDPIAILEEVEAARRVLKQGGYSVVDVTHKPIQPERMRSSGSSPGSCRSSTQVRPQVFQ